MAIDFPEGTQNLPAQILQVKQTVKQSTFSETVDRNQATGSCGLDVTITPTTTSSKMLIFVQTAIGFISDDNVGFIIQRSGTTLSGYLPTSASNRTTYGSGGVTRNNDYLANVNGNFLDSPSTTSEITYSVRLKYGRNDDNRTIYLNRGETDDDNAGRARSCSVITVMEVAG
tara:strand:- start:317 stop:832 length:516 start_codon:yes stop_codon:yes gene_type:complete